MGFLVNNGDIILDAVLTDLGRERLARGDGSFAIDKFALGDVEINYALYDKNNVNGSPYYDLEILQTPILEAFTDNSAMMKSKLLTFGNNNQLYLPILDPMLGPGTQAYSNGVYYVISDLTTFNTLTNSNTEGLDNGILNGYEPGASNNYIRVDQGLDTSEIPPNTGMDAELIETQYLVEMDNRLGALFQPPGAAPAPPGGTASLSAQSPSFIDDDNIAMYNPTSATAGGIVTNITDTETSSILGPRGTKLSFRIGSSLELRTSSFLFTQLGSLGTATLTNGSQSIAAGGYYILDTVVKITGYSTGAASNITLRFIRQA